MSGLSGLFTFLVTFVGLVIIVGLIFLAIAIVEAPEGFKKIARLAVGGVAVLVLLLAVGAALGVGGGGSVAIDPRSVIEFAIGIIILLVILYIIYRVVDYAFTNWLPGNNFSAEVKYVISAIAIVIILILAGKAIFGGGLGIIPGNFMGGQQHRSLLLEGRPVEFRWQI